MCTVFNCEKNHRDVKTSIALKAYKFNNVIQLAWSRGNVNK